MIREDMGKGEREMNKPMTNERLKQLEEEASHCQGVHPEGLEPCEELTETCQEIHRLRAILQLQINTAGEHAENVIRLKAEVEQLKGELKNTMAYVDGQNAGIALVHTKLAAHEETMRKFIELSENGYETADQWEKALKKLRAGLEEK